VKAQSKIWLCLLSLSTILNACGGDSGSSKNSKLLPDFAQLEILSTYPKHASSGFPLDGEIVLTFDQKVDSYSAIPENFELWTSDGDRVATPKLISSQFVPNPNNKDLEVSEMRFRLDGEYLLPETQYIFMWGDLSQSASDVDPAALGIQNLYGAPLPNGGIRFTTGTELTRFPIDDLEVLAMSPGRIISKGKAFEFDSSLDSLLNRSANDSYITVSKNSPIRIRFSEPIVDQISKFDLEDNGFSELKATSIEDFPNMMVALFDTQTKYSQIFASMANLATPEGEQAWNEFRTSYEGRLKGKVWTTDGRRTLNFALNAGETYPDTTAQVVIVIIWDLYSWQTFHRLPDNFMVAGFLHFSGVQFDATFPWDMLNGGGS